MSPSRRVLLTSGLALFTGCLSSQPDPETTPSDSTPPTSNEPTPSPTPSGPPVVSFVGYGVQRSGFSRLHPDFEVVWAPPDRQLLFAMVTVEGGRPTDISFDDFSLEVRDRTVAEADGVEGQDREVYYPYPDECECDGRYETYATFPLSAPSSAESAVVRWEGPQETHTDTLPDDALASLSAPTTTWELVSFDVPDSVGPDESFIVSFQARNVDDVGGTFRGVLNEEARCTASRGIGRRQWVQERRSARSSRSGRSRR